MKTIFHRLARAAGAAILCLAVATAACGGDKPPVPAGWHSGVGLSDLPNAGAAGEAAAAAAKESLGGTAPKIVVLIASENYLVPDLVAGVAKHFPKNIIYGCQATSPLVADTNFPNVASIDVPSWACVWALGGDMEVHPEWVATDPENDDAYYAAGVAMGEALKKPLEQSSQPGKVVVTFGDQYNGSNKDFAAGLNDGLEATYPIVGAAGGNITSKAIVAGDIKTGVNVGIMVAGRFALGQALNGGTHTPETADKTVAYALEQGEGKDPFFALLFNCRRRRQGMIERNQLGEELTAIKKHLPGVDFFGFYGPGEIGSSKNGEPAQGVGFTIVAAVFFPVDK